MPDRMRYLFDSDVLISSARLHYSQNYCQIFWDWLVAGHEAGLFFSIDKVKNELVNGLEDNLSKWVQSPKVNNFFQPSLPSLAQWRNLSIMANDPEKSYKESAKNKFLDVERADAWLIAYAAHSGNFLIVTNEVSRPESKSDIKLPDAASWLNVKTVKLYDLLHKYAVDNFTLSHNGFGIGDKVAGSDSPNLFL
ncbi:DUF4411 family protein [Chromobacterium violaceum]|uniref:DUF4411 domain-containing protein n=1 Tax=Chromobacterium violaceum TaxID=536 RepID=A0A202BBM7_CHRVL|nr:DUF4411 family protein [Chromobacterium violaceum]MBA8736924.1 DUF4411 family protein [Chromobacterium violaceum]OVE48755.1 hypothetical protein CBW21_09420 [Chromobacterium violaceum]